MALSVSDSSVDALLDWASQLLAQGILDDPSWRQDAACAGADNRAFYRRGIRATAAARAVCATCDVQVECLTVAAATKERFGIWGGRSLTERRQLLAALSARHPEMGLEQQELTWEAERFLDNAPGAEVVPGRKARRPHQVEAVDAATAELAPGGAAQVIMACGTGKTDVGRWVAEDLDSRLTLIQVPSLALVGQLLSSWRSSTSWSDVSWLTVCSKDEGGPGVAATTDASVVRDFLLEGGRRVVIATYRSGPVVGAANIVFDLAISDEAHHTTVDTDGPSGALVRGDIKARRRLYMTATPRSWRRGRDGADRHGMDDEAVYGRRVYELGLSQAIRSGLIADYRVVLAGVDFETYAEVINHPGLSGVSAERVVSVVAVLRTMAEYGLSRCVSFHSRLTRAHEFSRLVGPVAAALDDAERPEGPGWSAWLHGGSSPATRTGLLRRLQGAPGWGIVSNARVAGEGLDIQDLDTVAIVDRKTSEVDVAQAVGRALRAAAPGKVGTVVLPVIIGPDGEVSEDSLAAAGSVLRALRSHDHDLGERLDAVRRSAGRAGGHGGSGSQAIVGRSTFGSRLEFRLPPDAAGAVAESLTLRLVREASSSWDESFGHLQGWGEVHGHTLVPQDEVVMVPGRTVRLGGWVTAQRAAHRAGHLDSERATALESLPGWEWEPREAGWREQFDALVAYTHEHGTAAVPWGTEYAGVRLGGFVTHSRQDHRAGLLAVGRAAALEALPGWSWDVFGDAWSTRLAGLAAWTATHGQARPSVGDLAGEEFGGFDLGQWVSKQRSNLATGRLSAEQAHALRSLPGWVDDEREARWEEGLAHLEAWVGSTGEARPAQQAVTEDGFAIGRWVAKQRAARTQGRMSAHRAERLNALTGWSWGPQAEHDVFLERIEMIRQFSSEHGHARVPDGFMVGATNLGAWVSALRTRHRKGALTEAKRAALEAIPGWAWGNVDTFWWTAFSALETFASREGHVDVPTRWREGDVLLGGWVERQRAEEKAGRLSEERSLRLHSVPGWAREASAA